MYPPTPLCEAYPIAILLHDHWAIYALLPTPLLYAVNHTILVMAISCKGQIRRHCGFIVLSVTGSYGRCTIVLSVTGSYGRCTRSRFLSTSTWPRAPRASVTTRMQRPTPHRYNKSNQTVESMLGGWVNPHREQKTIPQGQTSIPRGLLTTHE